MVEKRRIGFENGKAIMKPWKKEKKPEIHYHITYNNKFDYNTSGMTPREINEKDNKIRREIINNRNCEVCGKRFETNQKICENCGVTLPRM